MAKISAEEESDGDGIVLFLKDNISVPVNPKKAKARSLYEILGITAKWDFGCYLKSPYFKTDVLKVMNKTEYRGVRLRAANGTRVWKWNNSTGFKSPHKNLGDWLESLDIQLPSPFTPVCYGGIFAAKVSKIRSIPKEKFEAIAKSLSRGDNIEEGHFAERTWAGILSASLSEKEQRLVMGSTGHVNWAAAKDCRCRLGALVQRKET